MSTPRWSISFQGKVFEVRAWPDRPFCATKVFTEGGYRWAVNAKGHLFCNLVDSTRFMRASGRGLKVLTGLARLGAVNRKSVAEINRRSELASKAYRRGHAAQEMKGYAEEAGIQLTKFQKTQISRLIRTSERARYAIHD